MNDDAVRLAAKVAGLREDEVRAAVEAYREAVKSLHDEPEWRSVMHIMGICVAHADGTEVQLELASATKRLPAQRIYTYRRKVYETFGEARAAELADKAQFKMRAVSE